MERLTVEEMKQIQLSILKEFVGYCEENDLDYFLCGGTLIGAVRHEGFIPWDDDIDVMMPRKSYQSFIEQYKGKQYSVFDCWSRDDYYYPFAKLVDTSTMIKEKTNVPTNFGIYIDIFPVDVLPSLGFFAKVTYARRTYYEAKMSSKTAIVKKRDAIHSILYLASKIVFKNASLISTVREIDTFSKRLENKKTSKKGRVNWGYGTKEIMPSEVYDNYTKHIFEGIICRIPVGYDQLLTSMYGDYMKLPPEEERIYRHDVDIYRLN